MGQSDEPQPVIQPSFTWSDNTYGLAKVDGKIQLLQRSSDALLNETWEIALEESHRYALIQLAKWHGYDETKPI